MILALKGNFKRLFFFVGVEIIKIKEFPFLSGKWNPN